MSSVLCNDCACKNVACGRCICVHNLRLAGNSNFRQAKRASELKKNSLLLNSNFCSNRRAVPTELTRTKMLDAAGFLVTSKGKTSILFEDLIILFFNPFELLVSSLSCSLKRKNRCISLRSFFHMFVVHSFAFSFCFNEIRTLIHRSLNTFLIQHEENQIFSLQAVSSVVAI